MAREELRGLARWSALKRGELKPEEAEETTPDVAAEDAVEDPGAVVEAAAEAGPGEEAILTEEDLPDIDSLEKGSDFTAFLAGNVAHHLHKKALRKLWRTDPVLANLDGLNDYDLDYTLTEAMQVAKESAMDLAAGVKRLNAADQRAREGEELRRARATGDRGKETAEQVARNDNDDDAAVPVDAQDAGTGDTDETA